MAKRCSILASGRAIVIVVDAFEVWLQCTLLVLRGGRFRRWRVAVGDARMRSMINFDDHAEQPVQ